MQPSFRVRTLTHLIRCESNLSGFTLLELLVVITIVGVLSAITVPIFASQINKAREAEAKSYVGAINRAQQMYYMVNQRFSDNLGELGAEPPENSTSYEYEMPAVESPRASVAAIARINATPPPSSGARGITGWVWIEQDSLAQTMVARSLLCEGKPNQLPSLDPSTMQCTQ